jgi:hypothetical protein
MEDFRTRDIKDPEKVFTENLGDFIRLEEYAQFLRDPFNPPARLAHRNPTEVLKQKDPAYADSHKDIKPLYYADANLSDDMRRPENIYEYLYNQVPKCPDCGRRGMYKKPQEYKDLEKKMKEKEEKQRLINTSTMSPSMARRIIWLIGCQ